MLFDQREKSYLFFSLFSLISSLEKSRGRFREKWRVKSEKWKVQKEKAAYATFLFGCGGGIFHCPPQSHSRNVREACFASFLLALWGIAARKQRTVLFSLAHPLPSSRRSWSADSPHRQNIKPTARVGFVFWLRRWDLNLTTFGLWARRAARLLHSAI